MLRLRLGSLLVVTALACAGCLVATDTPHPPTSALITATTRPATLAPPSATALAIVTATPSVWAPPTNTPTVPAPSATLLPSSPPPSETPVPSLATSTPIASETSTGAAPGGTAPPTAPPATVPPATALAVGISQFSIRPASINPGDSITLTWQATGAQAVIYRQEPGGPLTDMHTVPLSGTLVLQTPADLRNQVTYVLYAGAGTSTASATVSAVILCPDKWFFAPAPAGCPGLTIPLMAMAAERFEHGLMIWMSNQDEIYILYADGHSPAWSEQRNGWFAGQPESDPSLTPPAGLFQPVRGFGVIWRANNAPAGLNVRDRLGWASEPESSLTGGFQCDSAPKYNHCYLTGPGGQIYHLLPELSGWQVWHGP